eukprot:TRINITY_DN21344_c0_g1_i4.p2 TRINITY_DN21344_c0_g1~~TRINITY_DN21344_c0_g1_i4.p2  ORF type:complete len:175 (+),score=47.89 TRINITY_DN21344_c0_g1_i4:547-1071(+)
MGSHLLVCKGALKHTIAGKHDEILGVKGVTSDVWDCNNTLIAKVGTILMTLEGRVTECTGYGQISINAVHTDHTTALFNPCPLIGILRLVVLGGEMQLSITHNQDATVADVADGKLGWAHCVFKDAEGTGGTPCLLYTSDAADEEDSVDLGGRRIIKKKKKKNIKKKKKKSKKK